ncbi:hypothetical protein VNO80_19243 [Phaseolus coccineus]|uniref:Uncharacterized protein n=1 Tax=Phaseolus coccineus TaxID=3886 RepID=A0AAN9MFR8_PHACN
MCRFGLSASSFHSHHLTDNTSSDFQTKWHFRYFFHALCRLFNLHAFHTIKPLRLHPIHYSFITRTPITRTPTTHTSTQHSSTQLKPSSPFPTFRSSKKPP